MARDIRYAQLGDRNKYYKAQYVNQNKLTQNAVCQGVFYSTDNEPMNITSENFNGVSHKTKRIKIETIDYIPDLEIDDFVLYNNEIWLVESLDIADLVDNAKAFKSHPNKTIIGLKR